MSEVENNNELQDDSVQKEENSSETGKQNCRKTKFYYSFLTLVLLFCIVQIGFGAVLNISKTISNTTKIKTMENILDNAEAYNGHLKQEIKMFSTDDTLEGIARNNLKMAGEDEVLVIINEDKEDVSANTKNSKNKSKHNDTKTHTN